jgi:predicted transcriptional regulator
MLKYVKSRRRGFNEIVFAMVKSAYEGERKTTIMYRSSLNLSQLNAYLTVLVERGLLEFDRESRRYRSTERGKQYLKAYERYSETRDLLIEQEKMLEDICSMKSRKDARVEAPPQSRSTQERIGN